MSASMLYNLFSSNNFIHDDREPIITFTLPQQDQIYGLVMPSIQLWTQLFTVILIEALFSVFLSAIIYYILIPNRGSQSSYLLGFGILCPLTAYYLPLHVMHCFDIQNYILRFFAIAIFPGLNFFHILEAMYGFSPPSVETSFQNYAIYFSSVVRPQFDCSTHKIISFTFKDSIQAFQSFLNAFLFTGLLTSILRIYNYQPFPTKLYNSSSTSYNTNQHPSDSIMDILHPQHIMDLHLLQNNIIIAILFQSYLTSLTHALTIFVMHALGVKVQPTMQNPLFLSQSPSDFWAKRWNLVVHNALKGGIFKPVYKYSTRTIAMIITFIVSGIYHELILAAIFLWNTQSNINTDKFNSFKPAFGPSTAFFAWNGGMILLEHTLAKSHFCQYMKAILPKPIITLILVSAVVPIAHWFIHPYIQSNFFTHGESLFPTIRLI